MNNDLPIKKKRGNPLLKKGEQAPWLAGKDFKANPERINRSGPPKDMVSLRKLIQEMGAEVIQIEIGKGKEKKIVEMTRMERILLDWFSSQTWQKQQQLMQYGFGVPKQEIELSGDVKHIVVTRKKKEEEALDEVEEEKNGDA